MLIRGFSEHTTYSCVDCHLKCCATEYNLPLCGSEKQLLFQKYTEYQYYLQSTEEGDVILRGNSCPFLTKKGNCQLHSTSLKPLTCQIYPLILWRFNQKDILISISPCRGKGFQWNSPNKSKITESYIHQLLVKADNYFESYWGEEIDKNNPYESIPPSRVEKQVKYYNHVPENQLLSMMISNITPSSNNQGLPSFKENTYEFTKNDVVGKFVNSVLRWLIWSPVGLQLSIENGQLIFSTATLWLIEQLELKAENITSFLLDSTYIEQLSSFYASSILPSFWLNVVAQNPNKVLKSLAKRVYSVLTGEISQEELI